MEKNDMGIIVIVEGVDVATSSAVQARHSYKGDEIVWHHLFDQCLTEISDGRACLDFSKFHNILPNFQSPLSSPAGTKPKLLPLGQRQDEGGISYLDVDYSQGSCVNAQDIL